MKIRNEKSGDTKRIEVRLIVPMCFNDGKIIPVRAIKEIENNIIESAGGYTRVPCTGIWKDGKKLYKDQNSEYRIIISEDGISEFADIAELVKKICNQESIQISFSPITTLYI